MVKERKINEVFLDSENFTPGKRLKCVEDNGNRSFCISCVYHNRCINLCCPAERRDNSYVHFIETNEAITTETKCPEN